MEQLLHCPMPLEIPAMARLPRYGLPGQAQHVIQRGNTAARFIFAPEDYELFLECLPIRAASHSAEPPSSA